MKTVYTFTTIVLSILMLFLPLISITAPKTVMAGSNNIEEGSNLSNETLNTSKSENIRVYITEKDSVETFSAKDYIFGVVAAEMPALYETEALKAQAVAAYTYMSYKMEHKAKDEYDITDSYKTDQAFITRKEARKKWGEKATEYETKIDLAIDEVLYKKLTYNGKTILAAYHAISFGVTEDAKEIWGDGYPYLCSVDSTGDKLSKDYLTHVELSVDTLKEKLSSLTTFSGEASKYFGKIERTAAGSVKNITICGKSVSGSDVRAALELRSSNFTISFEDNKFIFEVKGYGHGLGLSQYGAHYMAQQGKNYKEILLHYYSGSEIK